MRTRDVSGTMILVRVLVLSWMLLLAVGVVAAVIVGPSRANTGYYVMGYVATAFSAVLALILLARWRRARDSLGILDNMVTGAGIVAATCAYLTAFVGMGISIAVMLTSIILRRRLRRRTEL